MGPGIGLSGPCGSLPTLDIHRVPLATTGPWQWPCCVVMAQPPSTQRVEWDRKHWGGMVTAERGRGHR